MLDVEKKNYSESSVNDSHSIYFLDDKSMIRSIQEVEGLTYRVYLLKNSNGNFIPSLYVEYTKAKSSFLNKVRLRAYL